MSKLVALSIAGGGALTASLFSAYMLGAFGSGIEIPQTQDQMDDWNGGVCNYFNSNVTKLKVGQGDIETGTESTFNSSNFFSNGTGTPAPQPSGCLVVNWDKTKYKGTAENEHKWTGTFRFLWTLIKGDKGLMVFSLAEAKKNKLKFYGSAYALENKSSEEGKGKKWTVVKKQDIAANTANTNKEMQSGDVESKFPKAFTTGLGLTSDWKFIDSTDDYSKIKGDTDDGASLGTTYFRGHWKFVSPGTTGSEASSSQKPHSWSSNMETWWTEIYLNGSSDTGSLNAKTMTDSITGKWENVHLSGRPKPTLTATS